MISLCAIVFHWSIRHSLLYKPWFEIIWKGFFVNTAIIKPCLQQLPAQTGARSHLTLRPPHALNMSLARDSRLPPLMSHHLPSPSPFSTLPRIEYWECWCHVARGRKLSTIYTIFYELVFKAKMIKSQLMRSELFPFWNIYWKKRWYIALSQRQKEIASQPSCMGGVSSLENSVCSKQCAALSLLFRFSLPNAAAAPGPAEFFDNHYLRAKCIHQHHLATQTKMF